jgi:hypothetical protein
MALILPGRSEALALHPERLCRRCHQAPRGALAGVSVSAATLESRLRDYVIRRACVTGMLRG